MFVLTVISITPRNVEQIYAAVPLDKKSVEHINK